MLRSLIEFPSLSSMPKAIVFNTTIGFVYGVVFKADPKIAACAFALSGVAYSVLFALANPLFKGDKSARSLTVLIVTSSVVNVATIIAFRQLKLIATLGTVVMTTGSLLALGYRCLCLVATQIMLRKQAAR